jgi:serine/threonine-protein kinase
MSLMPGSRLGHYEILSALGAGGMGEVYRARDTKLNRDVALKILPEAFTLDGDRIARFRREAQVLASLNHPSIAAIYGFEDSGSTHALVLELVEGPTLADRIAKGPIPLDEALPIARQIAEALEAAHEQGIIHRDLKPANIKVRDDGTVKVLDFGLAKAMEPASAMSPALTASPTITTPAQMTGVGMILGTAAYMSPEQAKGRPADKRSDVWAFGCVLYEMLTSTRAFEGEDVSDTLANVLKSEPDWNALPANLPQDVRTIIVRCLRKDRRQRFADIAVPLFFMNETSGTALPVAAIAARRSFWRRAVPFAAVAVLTGAIVAAAAWTLRPSAPSPMVTRFSVQLPAGQTFTNPGRQFVALSPDGANLVYVANARLYLRSMSDLEAHVIAGSDVFNGLNNPVFSPDGQTVAFYAADFTLKRLAVAGGVAVTICPADIPFGVSWGDGGIVFGQGAKGIFRVSPNGGRPEVIATVNPDQVASSPQMLSGGRAVLFSVKNVTDVWDKGQIVVQSLGSGARKRLVDGGSDGRYLPTGHLAYALSGVLLAVPFDLDRLAVSAGPVAVVEGVRRATTGTDGAPTAQFGYGANGSLVYVPGPAKLTAGDRDLVLFDGKGGVQPLKLPPGAYTAPRVSPDGHAVAFVNEDDKEATVWVYDLSGSSAARRLTFGGNSRAPIWSADGQWIAFQSDREGDLAIFRQRADGSGTAERLTKPQAGTTHTPQAWSPDGTRILFTVKENQEFRLGMMDMKDRRTAAFGDVRSTVPTEASFSPDGRWVAYQSRENLGDTVAGTQVFVRPFPATETKYLVPQVGGHPYWSRKGDLLILNVGTSRSMAIGVTLTPSVEFGRPQEFSRVGRYEASPFASRRNVDAMPDGRFVGVTESGGAATPRIEVVLNWFEELKQRVPSK